MLDPWIIEQIKKQEEEKRRREEEERREQPTVPADDPREIPGPRDERDRAPDPGYEMPNPNERKREDRSEKKKGEESGRGVTIIDIGGNIGREDQEDDDGTIDISKIPAMPPEDDGEKRPE